MKKKPIVRLTESALMIAFATVLSVVKILNLPYGGSVTAASMLPILLIAYRYGTGWGLCVGAVHGVLQLFLGVKNIMGVNFGAAVAILLLDYVVAFTVLGFGGVFRRSCKKQATGLALGALLGCILRYVCHAVAGATVWAEYNYSDLPTIAFSAVYNATYMLPETIITVLAAYYIGTLLEWREPTIHRLAPEAKRPDKAVLFSGIARTALLATAVYDLQALFGNMQDPNTGVFSAAGLAYAPWLAIAIVTVVGVLLTVVFNLLANAVPADDTTNCRRLFGILPIGAAVATVGAWGWYAADMLATAAEKAELAAPFTSVAAFGDAFLALGTKYGLPLLVVTLAAIAFVWMMIRRSIRAFSQKEN